jgi:chorismate synthase
VFEGVTLGTPIGLLVRNQDARPSAYEHMKDVYRPVARRLHHRGEVRRAQLAGRRARERARDGRRVAAGAIARKLLATAAAWKCSRGCSACTTSRRRSTRAR